MTYTLHYSAEGEGEGEDRELCDFIIFHYGNVKLEAFIKTVGDTGNPAAPPQEK